MSIFHKLLVVTNVMRCSQLLLDIFPVLTKPRKMNYNSISTRIEIRKSHISKINRKQFNEVFIWFVFKSNNNTAWKFLERQRKHSEAKFFLDPSIQALYIQSKVYVWHFCLKFCLWNVKNIGAKTKNFIFFDFTLRTSNVIDNCFASV